MENTDLIRSMTVNSLEAFLRIWDSPTKSGMLEGSNAGPSAMALQNKEFIKPFGKKEAKKQVWEINRDKITCEDVSLIRRIVNAIKEPQFVPYHDLVPQLDYNQSMRLRDVLQAGQLDKRDIEGVDPITDSRLIELGFCIQEDNYLKLSPKLKFNDYDYSLMQLVIDQINTVNERLAGESLRAEKALL